MRYVDILLAACRDDETCFEYLHYMREECRPHILEIIAQQGKSHPCVHVWAACLWICVSNSIAIDLKRKLIAEILNSDDEIGDESDSYARQIHNFLLHMHRETNHRKRARFGNP